MKIWTDTDDEIDGHALGKMREWIDDCYWDDLELIGNTSDLTNQEVIDCIDHNYDGGVASFLSALETGNGELWKW